jgi:YD repeat-containing protein
LALFLALCLALVWVAGLVRPTSAQADAPDTQTVRYTYDGAGRLVRVEYGDGPSIIYHYDAAGNLLRRQVVHAQWIYLPIVLKGA